MSNQVYRSDVPASPNVYVSDLVQPAAQGGTRIPGTLSIGVVGPATESSGLDFLVRDPSDGLVHIRHASTVPHTGATVRAVAGASQAIPDTSATLVDFGQSLVADAGVTYAAGVFTLLNSGLYTVCYDLCWLQTVGAGVREGFVTVLSLGAINFASQTSETVLAGGVFRQSSSLTFQASANDQVRVFAYQTSGAPQSLSGIAGAPDASTAVITRVTPASSV